MLIALLVAACGSETAEKAGGGDAGHISFSTRLDTRAGVIKDASGLAGKGGFRVWAFGHTGNWDDPTPKNALPGLDGTSVTSSTGGTTWTYGTPVYWPSDRRVSFFAYGPTAGATVGTPAADGTPVIDFTVPAAPQNQTDLLVAMPVMNQQDMSYSKGQPVSLLFKHTLARVAFSGVLLDAGDTRTIRVTHIVLNKLYGSGSTPLTDPVEWTLAGSPTASYTLTKAAGNLTGDALTTSPTAVSPTEDYLFLMPQRLARDSDFASMDVTLEITDVNGTGEVTYNSLVFSPDDWLPGNSYHYQIAVDGEDVRIVMVDSQITLEAWNISIMVQPISLTKLSLAHLTPEQITEDNLDPSYLPDDYNTMPEGPDKDAALAEAIAKAQADADAKAVADKIAATKAESEARIHSALNAFVELSQMGSSDFPEMPENNATYYAVYVGGDMEYDVFIDMTTVAYYDNFPAGKQIIFDIEKLITFWSGLHVDTSVTPNIVTDTYTFTVKFDAAKWVLMDSRQPNNEDIDAVTSATTNTNKRYNWPYGESTGAPYEAPSSYIRNKGAIILKRLP